MNPLIPPPVVALVLAVAMWLVQRAFPIAPLNFAWQSPIVITLLLGGLLLIGSAAASFIANHTTINPLRPARATHLITSGVFRFSRNPIYLGDVLLLIALAVWLGNVINLALLALFVWYIQRFQILPEEQALTQRFGDDYTAYCARVRRWL